MGPMQSWWKRHPSFSTPCTLCMYARHGTQTYEAIPSTRVARNKTQQGEAVVGNLALALRQDIFTACVRWLTRRTSRNVIPGTYVHNFARRSPGFHPAFSRVVVKQSYFVRWKHKTISVHRNAASCGVGVRSHRHPPWHKKPVEMRGNRTSAKRRSTNALSSSGSLSNWISCGLYCHCRFRDTAVRYIPREHRETSRTNRGLNENYCCACLFRLCRKIAKRGENKSKQKKLGKTDKKKTKTGEVPKKTKRDKR